MKSAIRKLARTSGGMRRPDSPHWHSHSFKLWELSCWRQLTNTFRWQPAASSPGSCLSLPQTWEVAGSQCYLTEACPIHTSLGPHLFPWDSPSSSPLAQHCPLIHTLLGPYIPPQRVSQACLQKSCFPSLKARSVKYNPRMAPGAFQFCIIS